MQLPRVLVIVGPTASGKTALALDVARRFPSEILSADSRQVYKLLNIGTAKPSVEDRKIVTHHFVDELLPDQHFSAGEFGVQGRKIVEEIIKRRSLPIIVGGTGLYIRSLVDGLFSGPGREEELRKELEARLESEGAEALLDELRKVDPKAASKMLPSNQRRIVRALEVYYATGKPISQHHGEHAPRSPFDPLFIGLQWDRKILYERINGRVEKMLAAGFLDEVKELIGKGYDDRFKSLQTVGYKEAFAFFRKEISYDRMVELMKQNTRRFAKRQLTWFRRDERIRWFEVHDEAEIPRIAEEVLILLK
ncbi:MAG TPA: tRNA (adenosine(37)-N6)-dimethylallyltransferase MiaA [Bacteroidota bacterium]|nr:tRNA (adenosine(37)-N6)-dimethylallyltransferase MiaA [Bacteroidota bacterium]